MSVSCAPRLNRSIGKLFLENHAIRFIIFDPATEEVREWIK